MPAEGDNRTVLVVGGDESTDGLVLRVLRLERHQVRVVPDAEAVDLDGQVPHLIVVMARATPGNGSDVCRALRTHDSTRHTPIVVVSDENSLAARVAARRAGADEFAVRKRSSTMLRECLRSAVEFKNWPGGQRAMRRIARRQPS